MALNAADQAFAERLAARLPPGSLRPFSSRYAEEPRGRFRSPAGLVVAPESPEAVATIVRACAAARVGIVPFGGGTGLVGGQILAEGPTPVILSTERLNRIRSVDTVEDVLVAEAGVTLAATRAAAEAAARLFPLSLASEGTASIGGVLAANAGGAQVLRYGNARALCLGVEAVLADGAIWRGLTPLRKDNLGYDLRDLLIGAEGTLGIVTAASLRLFPRPARLATGWLAVRDPAAALAVLARARAHLGDAVTACELIHRQGPDFVAETLPQLRQPLSPAAEWAVLLEAGGSGDLDIDAAFEAAIAGAMAAGDVSDGVIARSEAERAALWALREAIPEANRRIGAISSHDISVPLAALPGFIARGIAAIAALGPFRVNAFGHVGDGNLHFNVFPPPGAARSGFEDRRAEIKRTVHDLVHGLGGSVAAEHGVGRLKTADLARYGDPAKLAAMRAIKAALDPSGILNPGAVLPPAAPDTDAAG
jgi:FAD/FMN-containing dehydrogenase